MKADELIRQIETGATYPDTTRARIISVILKNNNEVFTKKEIIERLPHVNTHTLSGLLWSAAREKKVIDKVRVGKVTYYGSKESIQRVKDAIKSFQAGPAASEEGKNGSRKEVSPAVCDPPREKPQEHRPTPSA